MRTLQNTEIYKFDGDGEYNIPIIHAVKDMPNIDVWTRFNYSTSMRSGFENVGINFFVDDYQFERIWTRPLRYTDYVKKFGAVLSPDFSMYTDMPKPIQIFNKYRNNWLGAYWQLCGVTVIPTISWSDESSFDWCFDGFEKGGIVAVSNVGNCIYGHNDFLTGYTEMLRRLEPCKVLFFAKHFEDYEGPIQFIRYERW